MARSSGGIAAGFIMNSFVYLNIYLFSYLPYIAFLLLLFSFVFIEFYSFHPLFISL